MVTGRCKEVAIVEVSTGVKYMDWRTVTVGTKNPDRCRDMAVIGIDITVYKSKVCGLAHGQDEKTCPL